MTAPPGVYTGDVAPPIGVGVPQAVTYPPIARRYDLGTAILDGTTFVQPPGVQVFGICITNLDAAHTFEMAFGSTETFLRYRQGLFMYLPCTPLNDGIRFRTSAAIPGTTLDVLWFLGSNSNSYGSL